MVELTLSQFMAEPNAGKRCSPTSATSPQISEAYKWLGELLMHCKRTTSKSLSKTLIALGTVSKEMQLQIQLIYRIQRPAFITILLVLWLYHICRYDRQPLVEHHVWCCRRYFSLYKFD
jgi:hypothetical protein